MGAGINPHLNSLLQTPGTDTQPSLWPAFHSSHVNHIADFLNMQLPEHYTAYSEQSLQVFSADMFGGVSVNRPQPDVSIFQRVPVSGMGGQTMTQPTWQASIVQVLEPFKIPVAVVIREVAEQGTLGKVVTRIELLSPSNKTGDAAVYQNKRIEAIQSGVPLVEVDYLHETPSPIKKLPAYPQDADSYPYYIAVTDPRPTWRDGQIKVYGFRVGDAIPTVPIPLLNEDAIAFDFDAVYQHTFLSRRYANLIDASKAPLRPETYRADDWERIFTHLP